VKLPTYAEIVNLKLGDGNLRSGQVLKVAGPCAVVQVFEGTLGIDNHKHDASLREMMKMVVFEALLCRFFDGSGKVIACLIPR